MPRIIEAVCSSCLFSKRLVRKWRGGDARLRRPRVSEWADAEGPVLIPEGEKDADRLVAVGLLATCNPGGAGKWSRGFAPHFQDRDVPNVVWV
jgi:hypothetical protein